MIGKAPGPDFSGLRMWGMQGKVAVITGAANGIGRATARIFAAEGAIAILADVDVSAAVDAQRQIESDGGKALAVECDVAQADSVRSMVETVTGTFGRIDILHANAAVQINKEAIEITEEEWDLLHNVNLKGVHLSCKYAIPEMQRQGGGAIVISSSGHAFATYPHNSAYAATKGGELAYMRGLALDYAKDNIRVNCVIPGATDTRLIQLHIHHSEDPLETRRKLLESIPMRRLAKPEEIGQAVLFLSSHFAAYITGASLVVDGGLLAQN